MTEEKRKEIEEIAKAFENLDERNKIIISAAMSALEARQNLEKTEESNKNEKS